MHTTYTYNMGTESEAGVQQISSDDVSKWCQLEPYLYLITRHIADDAWFNSKAITKDFL